MIREPRGQPVRRMPPPTAPDRDKVFQFSLRDHTARQFAALAGADSITIDPHKSGYVPYPA